MTVIVLDGSCMPDREEIGNKARSIAAMRALGLPVPPAFVVPTRRDLPDEVWDATRKAMRTLEDATGRRFGTDLLVSVRSGAAQSMPGMMDTILDLGMDDAVETALAEQSGDPAFAADVHHRFRESFARTVKAEAPDDPWEQLRAAIVAVLASWDSPRARAYRENRGIAHDGGTAVTVQAMVFGNLDDRSGTGVLFTRNPSTGEPVPMGEFLPRGQGEDVVSGEADPLDLAALADLLPAVHAELLRAGELLEREAGDVQDIEFTVERGVLHLLQTRSAKRSASAALRIAADLVDEGMTGPALRITAEQIATVLRPVLDPAARAVATVLARGEAACPGIASGLAVSDPDDAMDVADERDVVLVRRATSPDDVHGMIAATGICTEVGGRTSHAAVVSRELGRPAVVGCGEGTVAKLEGREVTVDGDAGEILAGIVPVRVPTPDELPHLARLRSWAREHAPGHPLAEEAP